MKILLITLSIVTIGLTSCGPVGDYGFSKKELHAYETISNNGVKGSYKCYCDLLKDTKVNDSTKVVSKIY